MNFYPRVTATTPNVEKEGKNPGLMTFCEQRSVGGEESDHFTMQTNKG